MRSRRRMARDTATAAARAAAEREDKLLTDLRTRNEALLFVASDTATVSWEIVPCPEPGAPLTTYQCEEVAL